MRKGVQKRQGSNPQASGLRTDQVGKSVVDVWVHPWLCRLRKSQYISHAKPFHPRSLWGTTQELRYLCCRFSYKRRLQIYLSNNIYLCPAERVRRLQLLDIPIFVAIEATNIVTVVESLMNPNRQSDPSPPLCNINASKRRCAPSEAGDDYKVPVHVACVGSVDRRCMGGWKERKVNGDAWVQRWKKLWKDWRTRQWKPMGRQRKNIFVLNLERTMEKWNGKMKVFLQAWVSEIYEYDVADRRFYVQSFDINWELRSVKPFSYLHRQEPIAHQRRGMHQVSFLTQ